MPAEPRGPSIPELSPIPGSVSEGDDAPYARAWRAWLSALAHDPSAAWAAALVYRSLDDRGRDAWIDALEVDLPQTDVPAIALYAPLLGAEEDETRRSRIEAALLKSELPPTPTEGLRALRGVGERGRVIVLVNPLYLEFVEVLTCVLEDQRGFAEVRHDPLRRSSDAPVDGQVVEGVVLEAMAVEPLIEELAHAVVAHCRTALFLPSALTRFVGVFSPRPQSFDSEHQRSG